MTPVRAFSRNVAALIFTLFIFAPALWFVLDRQPPFIRSDGTIVRAADIEDGTETRQGVGQRHSATSPRPEDWIIVTWHIHNLRQDCRPIGARALTRTIIDGAGQIIDLDPVEALYDGQGQIRRLFQIPRGATPGPARYRSSACFICGSNPMHYFLPICVAGPEIKFEIGKP